MDIYKLSDTPDNKPETTHSRRASSRPSLRGSSLIPLPSSRTVSSDVISGLIITDIKQAVKNENRVNVFVNSKYSFSLDIAQVVDYGLKKGQKITAEKLAEYKKASEYGKLYQRTLEWVLMRPRSERETRDYLRRKLGNVLRGPYATNGERNERLSPVTTGAKERVREEYSEVSDKVISQLLAKGYINDESFARYYVENRFTKKGISSKRLRMELMKKGISRDIIDQVLEESDRNDEDEIRKIIAKKRSKYDDEKLIQYLCRQGFQFETVRNLVHEMDSRNSE